MRLSSADVRMHARTAQVNPGPRLPRHTTRPSAQPQQSDEEEEHAAALVRALDVAIRSGHLDLESHPIYRRGYRAGWRWGVPSGALALIALIALVALIAGAGWTWAHLVRWL